MKITNNFNLPQLLVDIVEKRSYKPREGRFSVTKLTSPPQINFLTLKHYDEIETDVSEYFWMFLGEGVHLFMEKYSPKYGNDSCETCKQIHQHKCIETLKEIVGGELHFHSDDFQIFWELDNEKVVKKELKKITQAIKGE